MYAEKKTTHIKWGNPFDWPLNFIGSSSFLFFLGGGVLSSPLLNFVYFLTAWILVKRLIQKNK